ncbi:DeoR/GlpR family DNA-binding transcription regulator [Paralimibaculum aggregatum]|nr:DeoR/GlpR family DNA-binding transcription regulator [Limibaculum sp. NKW23]
MAGATRRSLILDAARRDGRVTVDALAAALGVSAHTVRRDINTLCADARLRRLHGGAEYIDPDRNLPYRTRAAMNARAKHAIGRRIAEIVPDGATLFLSVGTTPAIVAAALAGKPGLTVITNNLNAAAALAESPGARVILPGGELRLPDRDLIGPEAADLFGAYRADFGIYGVGGIERDGTLLDFHEAEVRIRERIRQNSRRAVLVADHSKFGRHAPALGGRLCDAGLAVLDRLPPPPFAALLEGFAGRLVLAGETADA